MNNAAGAILVWLCLYLIPVGLLIQHRSARWQMVQRASRFMATWGLAWCSLAALLGGAMSGTVGFVGSGLAALLWLFWGSLCFAAVCHK